MESTGSQRAEPQNGQTPDRAINLTDDRPLGELVGEMTRDVSLIMRKEVELAKVEIKEEVAKSGKAAGLFGATGAFGYLALIMVSFAAAWGLAALMPVGWAFLIVGVVHAVIAAITGLMGKKTIKSVTPVPEQTVETLKEDVQWAKQQLK